MITKWLLEYMQQPWLLDEISCAAFEWLSAMDAFLRLCFTGDRTFFDRKQADEAHRLLSIFARKYVECAGRCHEAKFLFFNLTPKFHYILHVRDALKLTPKRPLYLNPIVFSTQMCEDYVGRVSQSSRTVHPLGVPLRVGQKWRLFTKLKWMEEI